MKMSSQNRCMFILIEVVCAMFLVGMVVTAVFTALHLGHDARRYAVQQHVALEVLDNTIERLAHADTISEKRAADLLRQEFRASSLGRDGSAQARCSRDGEALVFSIESGQGHLLARIEADNDE